MLTAGRILLAVHVSKLAEWRIMQVEFGLEHTLARDFTGKVFAWGNNEKGACGVSLERMKAVAGEDEDSTGSSPASSPLGKSDSDFKGWWCSCAAPSYCDVVLVCSCVVVTTPLTLRAR